MGNIVLKKQILPHAALIVDPDKNLLIDAVLREGVGHRDIQELIGNSAILRMDTLTDQQADKIVDYAEKQLGKPYDYEEMTRNVSTLCIPHSK